MSLLHRTKLSRPLTLQHLLLLPSSLRSRAFHASPRPQSVYLTAINDSQTALQGIHSLTGLPWAYSIPLFAVLLRCTVILPIAIYQRRANMRQVYLTPLVQSWRNTLQHEAMREVGHLGPDAAQRTLMKKLRAKTREIYKRNRCQRWKNYLVFAQLPIFLCVTEALRKMCGSREGLLGMLMGRGNNVVETGDGPATQALGIPVEMSMATEGMLWFPNLLVADPELMLPFVLSATMLLHAVGLRDPTSIWGKRFKRSLGVVCLAVGPLTINVPSALLLYWISSSGSAFLQAVALNKLMPIPTPVAPCKFTLPSAKSVGVQMPALKLRARDARGETRRMSNPLKFGLKK